MCNITVIFEKKNDGLTWVLAIFVYYSRPGLALHSSQAWRGVGRKQTNKYPVIPESEEKSKPVLGTARVS